MIDYNLYRIIELSEGQNREDIETKIIDILKEYKLSLSQVRSVFNHILVKIGGCKKSCVYEKKLFLI